MGIHPARANTPGLGGYAIVLAIVVVVFSAALAIDLALLGQGRHVTLAVVTGAAAFGIVLLLGSLPFVAILGLLHLLCRKVAPQWVHVGVAGGLGFVTGLAIPGLGIQLDGRSPVLSAALLGMSFAAGRGAVIPLVVRRRRQLVVKMVWG